MAVNLTDTELDISGWETNLSIPQSIGKKVFDTSWAYSAYEPLFGRGSERAVRHYPTEKAGAIIARSVLPLTGEGVEGDTDFAENRDNLDFSEQVVRAQTIRNSHKTSTKRVQKAEQINETQIGIDSLTIWLRNARDFRSGAALAHKITNCVVADATDGYKNTNGAKSVLECTKKVAQGDILSVSAIQQAIKMARNGFKYNGESFLPILPMAWGSDISKTTKLSQHRPIYAILLEGHQAEQIRNSNAWRELQKQNIRGEENPLLSGAMGIIDGCPVFDMGIYTPNHPGFYNSSVADSDFSRYLNADNEGGIQPFSDYADAQPLACGVLIGAGALIHAMSSVAVYTTPTDIGTKALIGVDQVFAATKAKFSRTSGKYTAFAGDDIATIGIFSSLE